MNFFYIYNALLILLLILCLLVIQIINIALLDVPAVNFICIVFTILISLRIFSILFKIIFRKKGKISLLEFLRKTSRTLLKYVYKNSDRQSIRPDRIYVSGSDKVEILIDILPESIAGFFRKRKLKAADFKEKLHAYYYMYTVLLLKKHNHFITGSDTANEVKHAAFGEGISVFMRGIFDEYETFRYWRESNLTDDMTDAAPQSVTSRINSEVIGLESGNAAEK